MNFYLILAHIYPFFKVKPWTTNNIDILRNSDVHAYYRNGISYIWTVVGIENIKWEKKINEKNERRNTRIIKQHKTNNNEKNRSEMAGGNENCVKWKKDFWNANICNKKRRRNSCCRVLWSVISTIIDIPFEWKYFVQPKLQWTTKCPSLTQ